MYHGGKKNASQFERPWPQRSRYVRTSPDTHAPLCKTCCTITFELINKYYIEMLAEGLCSALSRPCILFFYRV